jgi:hypothetical protein
MALNKGVLAEYTVSSQFKIKRRPKNWAKLLFIQRVALPEQISIQIYNEF